MKTHKLQMKQILALLVLIITGFSAMGFSAESELNAQTRENVIVGIPFYTESSTSTFPGVNPDGTNFMPGRYPRYAQAEFIYLAEEIGGATTIRNIALFVTGIANPDADENLTNYRIYMGHTTDTMFNTTGVNILEEIAKPEMVNVFTSKTVTVNDTTAIQGSWYTFNFDTPFDYNGRDNLKLIVMFDLGSPRSVKTIRYFSTSTGATGWPELRRPMVRRWAHDTIAFGNYGNTAADTAVTIGSGIFGFTYAFGGRFPRGRPMLCLNHNTSAFASYPLITDNTIHCIYSVDPDISVADKYTNNRYRDSYGTGYVGERKEFLYWKDDFGDKEKVLTHINIASAEYNSNDTSFTTRNDMLIYMKHTKSNYFRIPGEPTNIPYEDLLSYQLVHQGKWNRPPRIRCGVDFITLELQEPFVYNGEDNVQVLIINGGPPSSATGDNTAIQTVIYADRVGTWGNYRYKSRGTNNHTTSPNNWQNDDMQNKQLLKLNYVIPPTLLYHRATSFNMSERVASIGASNTAILGVNMNLIGVSTSVANLYLQNMAFDGLDSYDRQQILRAKLYYTAGDSMFATTRQVGGDITISNTNRNDIVFTPTTPLQLVKGRNYFWLAYDLNPSPTTQGDSIRARLKTFNLFTSNNGTAIIETITPSAETINSTTIGMRAIAAGLDKDIYYVGPSYTGGPTIDYPTLSACAADFTQKGITKPMQIVLTGDITDATSAVFGAGVSQWGDFSLTLRPESGRTVVLSNNSTENINAMIQLNGVKNFIIEGSNNLEGTTRSLRFACTGNRNIISVTLAENITIRNTILGGGSLSVPAVNFNQTSGIQLTNNAVNRASAGFAFSNSSNIQIVNNDIGSIEDANACANGILLDNGSRTANIYNNRLINLRGSDVTANGILIRGNTARENLNINIFNNSIKDIGTTSTSATSIAAAFSLANASNVNIFHNTVILNKYANQRYTTFIDGQNAEVSNINVKNNLFVNTFAEMSTTNIVYGIYAFNPSAMFNNLNNNLYSISSDAFWGATSIFAQDKAATSGMNFTTWKNTTSKEQNSVLANRTADFISATDFHIAYTNGDVFESGGMLIPVLTTQDISGFPANISSDIDGATRGTFLNGFTTAGADEAMIQIARTIPDFPANEYTLCDEGAANIPIELVRQIDFVRWVDNIARTAPTPYNSWVYTDGTPIVNNENGFGINYPHLFITPNYTQTGNIRAITHIGYVADTSNVFGLFIIKHPEISEHPPRFITTCANAGSVRIPAMIDGTANSLQWQKENASGVWENITGQNNDTLILTFANNATDRARIEGKYRLQINPFDNCNPPPVGYTTTSEITVGNPITTVNPLEYSVLANELLTLCSGREFWFRASIPQNSDATITGYRWQKLERYSNGRTAWTDISNVVNPTAATAEYRISSLKSEDAGEYRCIILGPSDCVTGSSGTTSSVTIAVNATMEIIQHPVDITACVGTPVTIPVDVSGEVIRFRWYKDGKIVAGATERDFVIEHLDFEDAGRYELQIFYRNCRNQSDSTFAEPMQLFVYGLTEIVKHPESIIAIPNSYARLNIQTHTVGDELGNAPVTYQWYRQRSEDETDTLKNTHKYGGTTSSTLIISPVADIDVNDHNNPMDYYYCVVKGFCDNAEGTASNPVLVRLAPNIRIEEHPISLEMCVEGSDEAVFAVRANTNASNEVIGYRWYRNDVLIATNSGVNKLTDTFRIANPQLTDAGSYKVAVFFVNLGSTAIESNEATLIIEDKPIITSLSGKQDIQLGTSFTLSVAVRQQHNNYAVEYQWFKDGVPLQGATGGICSISNATINDEGNYYVVITSLRGCGETTSEMIEVTVGNGSVNEFASIANFGILSVRPNPVTSDAVISYEVPAVQEVKLSLLDLTGKTIQVIYTGLAESGINSVNLKQLNISNGTYFIVLESNGHKSSFSFVVNR